MATILYAWELGGGLGHVLPFRPVGQQLIERGHRVVAAVRELKNVGQAFGGTGIAWLPAPHKSGSGGSRIEPMRSFAHILHNTGCGSPGELHKLSAAWRTIIELVRPDLVICDHCPTALLALRGTQIRHVTLGTGFFCPPHQSPWPPFGQSSPELERRLADDERRVLEVANSVLNANRQPPLEQIADLYAQADDQILTTVAELDHYPQRAHVNYAGFWPAGRGQPFSWPVATGPRVYAYLKEFAAAPQFVQYLGQRGWPTVLFAPDLFAKLTSTLPPNVAIFRYPLSLPQVAREADIILQNANHATLLELLLAGRAVISIPLTVEQAMLAGRVAAFGISLTAEPFRLASIVAAVDRLMTDPSFSTRARTFAAHYATHVGTENLLAVVNRLENLLGSAPSTA